MRRSPSSGMLALLCYASFFLLSSLRAVDAEAFTPKHEEGRCAIRGHCGKKSFFGSQLPCPDNGLAEEPEEDTREKLVRICGDKWNEGPVCCDSDQVCCPKYLGPLADGCPARYPGKQSQARRRNYLDMPSLQSEFLQSFLYV